MGCESVVTFGVLAVMAFSHLMPCGPRPLSRGFPQFPSVLGSHTNVTIPTPLKRQTDKWTRNKTRATGPGHGLPTIWTSLLSGPILGLTLPSTPSHKLGPLTTQERPPADPAPVTFPHRLRPPPAVPTGPSVPTFESPCPGDLFDKPCLDSLRQNSSLSLGPSLWTCYTNYCIFFFWSCLFIYLFGLMG